MSIQTELTRITNAKAAIKTAIEGKGVTVPAGTLLDGMASLIESIEAGGGAPSLQSKYVTYTANGTATITPDEGYDGLSSVDVTVNVSGGGGGGDHADEDAIVSGTITEYTNDRVTKIASYAFYNCSSLTSADFTAATRIGESAFVSCSSLTSANFPAATSIGDYAFSGCSNLTSADFPAATSIGVTAFFRCSNLTSLILRATTQVCTLSNTNAFNNTPIKSGTGYIYVPAALVDSYKTATNWTTYANQFRALESYTVDGTTTGELDPTKVNA